MTVSTERDTTFTLDEILGSTTELPVVEHTTDSHGQTLADGYAGSVRRGLGLARQQPGRRVPRPDLAADLFAGAAELALD